jgi:hypothetical protein
VEHSVFVAKYRSGHITVTVEKNKAGFMYGSPSLLPKKSRTQQALLRNIAFGGVLVGFVLFFFAPWWIALAVLALGLYMFPKVQNLAARHVLEAALENPHIYQSALQKNVLIIKEQA